MCARLLKHKAAPSRPASPRRRSASSSVSSSSTGAPREGARASAAHARWSRSRRCSSRSCSTSSSPRASFRSRTPASSWASPRRRRPSRSPRWPSGSRRWRRVILEDPAVESLSSFIGVDGTNTTLNSGRIQINLKPLDERKTPRQRRHPPSPAPARAGRGHHALHAARPGPHRGGPRQPHAVSSTASRTRLRTSCASGRRSSWRRCRSGPSCADVATDQQIRGLQHDARDRPRRRRRGSASHRRPSTTRSTTRSDSVRSRRCSRSSTSTTSFWKRDPSFQKHPSDLGDIYVRHVRRRRPARRAGVGPLPALRASRRNRAARSRSTTRANSQS